MQALSISNSTSSSTSQQASNEVASYLATLGTGKADEARNWKPSSIVQNENLESQDLGSLEYLTPDRAPERTSSLLRRSSKQAKQLSLLPAQRQQHSFDITEESSDSQGYKRPRGFETYASSCSSDLQGQGKRQRSTKPSGMPTFTVWQAKSLCGSTGMTASVFCSLTTLRARLGAKHSYETWMGIRSNFQSKEALHALATVLLLSVPMTKKTTRRQLYEEFSQVESSGSTDDEESISISSSSCEESDSSDQEDMIDLTQEDEPCEAFYPPSSRKPKTGKSRRY